MTDDTTDDTDDTDEDTVGDQSSDGSADESTAPTYAAIDTVGELTPDGFERFMRHDATTLELRHGGDTKLVLQETGKPDITRPSMHRLGGGTKRLEWSVDTVVTNPVHGMDPSEDSRWNDPDADDADADDGDDTDGDDTDGDDTDGDDTDGMTFSMQSGPDE